MNSYEKDHLSRLRRHLAECTLFLRVNGDFPLESPCRLALYGSGARHTIKGGTGSGEVNSRFFVTIEEGLEQAGFTLTTKSWLYSYDKILENAKAAFLKEIKEKARQHHTLAVFESMGAVMPEPEYELPLYSGADAAVYVLSRISGEGSDRNIVKGDILLTDTEKRDILALNNMYPRFMLVLNTGGPVDLSPLDEVKNILLLSQLGVETGSVLADILLGNAFPSGKLATTWPAFSVLPAVGEFGGKNDTRYTEGIYVGYRYYDTAGQTPLFPFGFGLGYTTFNVEPVSADASSVTVMVKNTGKFPGKEVVPLYVYPPEGDLDKPLRTLAAYRKTSELRPGESEFLTIPYSLKAAASYNEKNASWILEAGDYTITAGDIPAVTLQLPETVIAEKTENALGTPDFEDWKPEKKPAPVRAETVIILSPDVFSASGTCTHQIAETLSDSSSNPTESESGTANPDTADPGTTDPGTANPGAVDPGVKDPDTADPVLDPVISALSDEELVCMATGAFKPGLLSGVVGDSAFSVAGAAGETFSSGGKLPVLVMADGPAGLRLTQRYYRDEKGVHGIGASTLETLNDLMPKPVQLLLKLTASKPMKPMKKAEIRYQYCTAIPIGTAIAQSWNTEFAELCGDIVGEEMQRFGIQLWLAPALNIHRNIRCGRNFEYYSEDPYVTGKTAAAITKGVQKHPGCSVTLKHFAANNQETNRYNSNSLVSERAMREIYLKGFEIAVKEARPRAIMTSYNLLNGTHTSERRDLIENILRGEWGFRGIVMTDWVIMGGTFDKSSVHPAPTPWKVAAAGGDLFMPGSKKDQQNILEALQSGQLSRKQLEINATRVLRLAQELNPNAPAVMK